MTQKTTLPPAALPVRHDDIDLVKVFGTLMDDRWLILQVTAAFFLVSLCYAFLASPVYRADALVQVEKNPGVSSLLEGAAGMLQESDPASSTETEIIKSRMVAGKAVGTLGLDIAVTRKQIPILGPLVAAFRGTSNDSITVGWFKVPPADINQPFQLTFTDARHYILSREGAVLLRGQMGQSAYGGGHSLFIEKGTVTAGDTWTLVRHPFLEAYNRLIGDFDVSDKGKDTGVLGLVYDNPDPVMASAVLNNIVDSYFLQNVNRKTEQAQKSLEFLRQQLPQIREQLDGSEQKLNAYRQKSGTVDMSLQAKALLDNVVQLDGQLNQLTFRETDIAQLYTRDHPSYRALLEKRQLLEKEKARLNKDISQLPATQQEVIRLSRDVDVQQQVYVQMLNRQQELNVMKASATGYVRIIDRAMTRLSPVRPLKLLVILAGTLLGLMVSVGLSLVRKSVFRHIDSPDALENAGINVLASIPFSQFQGGRVRKIRAGHVLPEGGVLAVAHPTDLAVEAIRSLRTGLHFTMMQARNNILMISGVSPGIGKSFVSANLAAIMAQGGRRTLIIDADMRKGYLHSALLAGKHQAGLSEVLAGRKTAVECITPVPEINGLDVLPRGEAPSDPTALLVKPQLEAMLAWASTHYEVVIVDTPPVLAVTDAAILGRFCGTSMLVVRFEENSVRQAEISIRRFRQSGVEISGAILNAVVKRASSYYSADGHYQYDYRK